ncbi:MAG: NADPH-dependent F420 reductase [Bryobacteraceae bacterium]|nr:NADPH-dependent F420 reductase [Bryobacteraceae bacterium]
MKIGIIGSGNVGGALGCRWAQAGHEVIFASRHPQSPEMQELIAKSPGSRAASDAEAVSPSEILVLATPWPPTEQIVRGLGDLGNRIVIDATNALKPDLSGMALENTTSGAEQVSKWALGGRVVKAFNTVGSNIMENSTFGAEKPVLFYCGDDAEAKKTVHALAAELGFDPQDAGPLDQARLLEPFALLWITLALKYGYGREIAFKFLRR